MIRRRRSTAALVCLLALGSTVSLCAQSLAYDVRAAVIVMDADKASRALSGWAEDVGGYFLVRSLESVVFRIPAARVGELRSFLERTVELVVTYEPATTDTREELAAVRAAITSREEALGLILKYVGEADVAGTLALEKEISGLMEDLEIFEGRRRRLENDAAFARVEVTLSSRRQSVPSQRPSSFAWINTVDLYRFISEVLPYGR